MKCNATLQDEFDGVTHHCQLDAGHYRSKPGPDFSLPKEKRDPRGWHQEGVNMWADYADGAAPHVEEAAPADPLLKYRASIRFGRTDGAHLDWESPYEITVSGPAAFVAHVVTSVADAFEEDVQR
jgi:hypothetical protein